MEWNIQARAHACQSCKKQFSDQEPFHTMLFEQKHGYERVDVCEECWKNQFSEGAVDRKGFISYWQSIYTVPPAAPPEPLQKETAETLLRKLAAANDPKYGPALYILGAMLERKRILKVKTQLSRGEQRIFVYEHGKSGDLFQIVDPNLQLHQLEGVQHEVLHLLQHGFQEADAIDTGGAEVAAITPEGALEDGAGKNTGNTDETVNPAESVA